MELVRVILQRRYGVSPACVSHAPDLDAMLRVADAALIIGDPALRIDPASLPWHVYDLGAEWVEMTGLPMVFAVWAGRKGTVTPELTAAFQESCRYGLDRLEEIVAAESSRSRVRARPGARVFDAAYRARTGSARLSGDGIVPGVRDAGGVGGNASLSRQFDRSPAFPYTRGKTMYILLLIVHVIVCLFLIIVVLLQSGKAADLAGAFGGMGSQTAFGPRGSATLLSKATTISAVLFMVTSLSLSILATRNAGLGTSVLETAQRRACRNRLRLFR